MMSAFLYFQITLNRLFKNCIKLYWYWDIDIKLVFPAIWRGWGGIKLIHPEKTTVKKPSLIRVNNFSFKKLVFYSINKYLYGGVNLVPMAVPEISWMILVSSSKKLFFSINLAI